MTTPAELHTVAIIGNGIIGHGLAQVFAVGKYPVRLIGRNPQSLAAATDKIKVSLARFVANELVTTQEAEAAVQRILTSTNIEDAAVAELIIEAVTEDLALKHELFSQLDEIVRCAECSHPPVGNP